jgi:isoleucyl-tRNA synthetase
MTKFCGIIGAIATMDCVPVCPNAFGQKGEFMSRVSTAIISYTNYTVGARYLVPPQKTVFNPLENRNSCLKRLPGQALTIVLTGVLLVVSAVLSGDAIAQTLNVQGQQAEDLAPVAALVAQNPDQLIPAAQPLEQDSEETTISVLQNLTQETQRCLEKAIKATNEATDQLLQTLESAAYDTRKSAHEQLKQDLEARAQLLEDTSEAVDELGENVGEFKEKLQNSAKDTPDALKAQLKQSINNTQEALTNSSKAIETLAADVERAKEEPLSASLVTQMEQHIDALNQSLEEANQLIKSLSQKAA